MAVWGKLSAEPIVPEAIGTMSTTPPVAAGTPGGGGTVQVALEKAADQGDKSLPDPTARAGFWAVVLLVVAVVVGIAVNELDLTAAPFNPAEKTEANFALFAGFYVGAQVIERLMEFVSPLLPRGPSRPRRPIHLSKRPLGRHRSRLTVGSLPSESRPCWALQQAASLACSSSSHRHEGVADCRHDSHGITIAAGTKPSHDFITSLQNRTIRPPPPPPKRRSAPRWASAM